MPTGARAHPASATIPTVHALLARPAMTPPPPLRVGLLGAGTVGREVVRALRGVPGAPRRPRRRPRSSSSASRCATSAGAREPGIAAELLTDAPAHLVASDPRPTSSSRSWAATSRPGRSSPRRSRAGKAVVTANKHVIAHHGAGARGVRPADRGRPSGSRRRSAAGIPVLGPARRRAGRGPGHPRARHRQRHDELHPHRDGRGGPRLRRGPRRAAQAAGYAEADPSGDVEGDDAVNKLVILTRLAFGVWVDPADIVRRPPTSARRRRRAGPGSPG